MPRYSTQQKEEAKQLYLEGFTVEEIAKQLNMPHSNIVHKWRDADNWEYYKTQWINGDDYNSGVSDKDFIEVKTAHRLNTLIELPDKTERQLNEIIALGDLLIKLQRLRNIEASGETTLRSKSMRGDAPPKQKRGGKKTKNDVSALTQEDFDAVAADLFFDYQLKWRGVGRDKNIRDRWILKSRQIGATFFFSFEAFERAVITGKNQIFISASRRQAEVFKGYIVAMAKKYFEIDLSGSPIVLSNDAQLIFLSTNASTAQSEHGDLYFDECMWVRNFDEIYEVASPMASQKQYTTTCFSTPSTISHEAYKYFSGSKRNEGRPKDEHITLDVSHKALKKGRYDDSDKTWRQIVTIYDAQEQGCDLFDIDYLKSKYTPSRFDNLFGCEFIDDSNSVFSLNDLLKCAADPNDWKFYNKDKPRPYGNHGVLVGYDPSRSDRDKAEIVVLSQPHDKTEPFRLLERISMRNATAQQQADEIERLQGKYNIVHLGVDKTGPGVFVFDTVVEIFPNATPIIYSPDMKTRLVEKARDVIANGRFEFDIDEIDVPMAFLSIRQTATSNGQITYVADRSDAVGHGDVAWAIMHAMISEPLAFGSQRKTKVVFSD